MYSVNVHARNSTNDEISITKLSYEYRGPFVHGRSSATCTSPTLIILSGLHNIYIYILAYMYNIQCIHVITHVHVHCMCTAPNSHTLVKIKATPL